MAAVISKVKRKSLGSSESPQKSRRLVTRRFRRDYRLFRLDLAVFDVKDGCFYMFLLMFKRFRQSSKAQANELDERSFLADLLTEYPEPQGRCQHLGRQKGDGF